MKYYAHPSNSCTPPTPRFSVGHPAEVESSPNPQLFLTAQRWSHEAEEVKLCTMHSIKGLEARVVFILGVDEGNLPNVTTPSSDIEAITQERKLLYVGMTRAKEWLYLISGKNPSRYLR